jgi:hypothetical protein
MRRFSIAAGCAVVVVVGKADVLVGQNKTSGSEAALDCGALYIDRSPANQLRIKLLIMFDYNNFEEVFSFNPNYSYDSSEVETIEANRRKLEGLFVDKVLRALDIKRRKF